MGSIALAEVWDKTQTAPTQNLGTLLSQSASQHANRTALVSLHQHPSDKEGDTSAISWTYAQLHEASLGLAHQLSANGVAPGSRIGTILFNQIEWALMFWATAHLGCQFIGIDYRAVSHKDHARDLLESVPCDVIVASNNKLALAVDEALGQKAPIKHRYVVESSQTPGWKTLAELSENATEDLAKPMVSPNHPEETAVIFFTSGTTGTSKACPHSAVTLYSVARGLSKAHAITRDHTICQHLPGFHIFSVVYSLTAWLQGASLIFPNSTFDADCSIRAIQQSRNVVLPCVPLMIQAIARSPIRPPKFETLETVTIGGSTVFPELLELCASLGPKRLAAGYGMSESLVVTTHNQKAEDALTGGEDVCLGTAVSGACIRICQPGSRTLLSRGEIGEVHLGGLPVFGGYLGLEHESCYREDGANFVVSGDQGYLDEQGRLYVLGRYKDLIIRGGENISPFKIERVLSHETGITAQVVGVPDTVAGEAIVAIIRRDSGIELPHDELRNIVSKSLGPQLSPSMIFDLTGDLGHKNFPMTPSGKPQKATLRQWTLEHIKKTNSCQLNHTESPIESQLTEIWSSLTGRSAASISPDTSIHTFTDSMTLIQFCSAVFERYQKSITVKDLGEFKTVRSQAMLLEGRQKMETGSDKTQDFNSATPPPWREQPENRQQVLRIKQAAMGRLDSMGLDWGDVEDVYPKNDIIGPMARGARPNSWNHRHSVIVRNCDQARITSALHTWATKHPLMRSITVSDEHNDFYIIMPARQSWLCHQICHGGSIDNAEDTLTYRFNEPEWDHVAPPGPFFKVTILPINNTPDIGLIFHWHHVIFDGVIIRQWYRELGQIVKSQQPSTVFHPFQRYSVALNRRMRNVAAQHAIDHHVQALRGISAARDYLWPPQRVPLWLKGDDSGWKYPDGRLGEPGLRTPLDGNHAIGTMGLEYAISVPQILGLRERFEIPPPIVAKGACVLLNMHLTGGEEAILVTNESGRSWPFVDSAAGDEGKSDQSEDNGEGVNPLSIDGPTVTLAVSRTRLLGDETVVQFLARLLQEQHVIEQHSHAPVAKIIDRLESPPGGASPTSRADADVVRSILNRQVFDWLPDISSTQSTAGEAGQERSAGDSASVEMLEVLSRTDLGFVWYPSLKEADTTLKLNTTWDDAQMHATEVSQAMKGFLSAVAWLSKSENWERPARECRFDTEDEITDVGPEKCYRR
ncbi:unnamed protein product [Penicillium salamii]|nr:unnamed protein product [Penicillium salamii]CAG8416875.1 unnamed protein product [Penicillium salamii]